MKRCLCLIGSLLLLLPVALSATEPRPTLPQQQANQLIEQLETQLKSRLMIGLQQGPIQAIAICREQAPEIARQLSVNGITIGRTSHKLRSPDNSSPDWVTPLLERYQHQPAPAAPSHVILDNGDFGYVKPIYIKPPCLTCHGQQLSPPLSQQLHTLYPKDAATGFQTGDFRGLFWVRLPQ